MSDAGHLERPTTMAEPQAVRRWVATTLFVFGLVWVGYLGWSGLKAKSSAEAGRDRLELLAEDPVAEAILRGELDEDMRLARADFDDAAGRLGGLAFWPVRQLPWIGRQVRSASSMSGAGREVLDIALELTATSSPLMDQLDAGTLDEGDALAALGPVLGELHQQAIDIDLGPDEALFGPLSSARIELGDRHAQLVDALGRSAAATIGVADFLEGPGTYLLFAANNAQMQSGSGKLLSVGTLEVRDGDVSVGLVRSIATLELPSPAVELEADFAARWGWLEPGSIWANLGLTPRFDVTAATALDMWDAIGNSPVDGVVIVDPVALSAVIRGTGSIVVDGEDFSADSLLTELLHDQYFDIGEEGIVEGSEFEANQTLRRDRLASIAAAVMATITNDDVDQLSVLLELDDAARGRHIMFYSVDPTQQRAWSAAQLSGELQSDSMMLSLVNRSATKSDQFINLSSRVEVLPAAEGSARERTEVVVTVTIQNNVPLGEPSYIAGARPELGLLYGDYLGVLALNIPGAAANGRVDDDEHLAVVGADGPTRVVGSWVTVPQGQSVTRVFRFDLPKGFETIRVEPSARVPVVFWDAGGLVFDDSLPNEIVVAP
jgi:hypothetical protein